MITVTIKLKSYLPTSVTSVSSMDGQGTESKGKIATLDGVAAAVSATERLATMVDTLTKRMEKLDASHGSTEKRPAHGWEGQRNYTHRREVIYSRCNQQQHIARYCCQAPAGKLLTFGESSG